MVDAATKKLIKSISIDDTSSIKSAMAAIDAGGIGLALLVNTKHKTFAGLVTDGDIRRALLAGAGLSSPAASIPRPNATISQSETSTSEIASLFSKAIRIIPILNNNNQVVDLAMMESRLRLPIAEPVIGEKELSYVTEAILGGWVSSAGSFITRFEKLFAEYCGSNYAIATSSGTTALHLALEALNITTNDEVIVPSFSFISTANAVCYTGAQPIFVDSEQESWNIDPELIEESITPATKAIIAVHIYGHPAKMDAIRNIASKNDLKVIEDAAEAHGALYKGHRVGNLGDVGCFSFYGNKTVTTGEGGMIVTDNPDLAEKIRILRDHGMSPEKKYWHIVLGYNYRMTNLQAALGVAQMEKIDSLLAAKERISLQYSKALRNVPGINLPQDNDWAVRSTWLYTITINAKAFGKNRDELMEFLKSHEIDARPAFPSIHNQPIYNTGQKLAVAEELSNTGLSLPSSVNLLDTDVDRVCTAIKAFHEN